MPAPLGLFSAQVGSSAAVCMLGCITRPDAARLWGQGEQVVHRICRGAVRNATSDLVGNRATALKLIAG